MSKRIIVIGAGIGGLAVGYHALSMGWECDIFEMHDKPGGLCTTWQRNGYSFDGCIRFLLGTVRQSPFYDDWKNLGALDNGIAVRNSYLTYESIGRRPFVLHKNAALLGDHIAAVSPVDRQAARELIEAVETIRQAIADGGGDAGRRFARIEECFNAVTVDEYVKRFSHPGIQGGLRSVVPPNFTAFCLLLTLSQLSLGDGNWPLGGSLALARSMETKFVSLGGRTHYRTKAAKIIVRGAAARGIRLDDGAEVEGDAVVAAVDAHEALYGLLGEDRLPVRIRKWFDTMRVVRPVVQVSLGIRGASFDCPAHLVWELETPADAGGAPQRTLDLLYFVDDPSMALPGRSVMTCLLQADYPFWHSMARSRGAYEEEKERTAAWVIAQLCSRIPAIRGCIEIVDVATPVTYERMTGVWKGACEGWDFDRATCRLRFPRVVPNLKRFYMAGQWIKPGGGLVAAMTTGNETVRHILDEGGRA